jgi:ABC-type dipeptide/oligopeptide/nickel transport system permease component
MGNALQGDFGIPFQSPTETVTSLIARAWPITIRIGIPTIVLAYGVGSLLGYIAAKRQNGIVDYVVTFMATLGICVPNFVLASGSCSSSAFIWDGLNPAVGVNRSITSCLCWPTPWPRCRLVARYTRSSILEVMNTDYVRTARAKGLSENRVMIWHVVRNALIPFTTILVPEIPNILTGSIFIEATFRIPVSVATSLLVPSRATIP